jgi:hypothetical protein
MPITPFFGWEKFQKCKKKLKKNKNKKIKISGTDSLLKNSPNIKGKKLVLTHLNLDFWDHLTLRSVSSINNAQNSEMKFCEKYEVDMLKLIVIIRGYIMNNFTTLITILWVEKIYNFKI